MLHSPSHCSPSSTDFALHKGMYLHCHPQTEHSGRLAHTLHTGGFFQDRRHMHPCRKQKMVCRCESSADRWPAADLTVHVPPRAIICAAPPFTNPAHRTCNQADEASVGEDQAEEDTDRRQAENPAQVADRTVTAWPVHVAAWRLPDVCICASYSKTHQ